MSYRPQHCITPRLLNAVAEIAIDQVEAYIRARIK
jgi:hypothetical protein